MVHLARLALGHLDTLALASAVDIAALEPPLGVTHVVHGTHGGHGIADAIVRANLAAVVARIGKFGGVRSANVAPQRGCID